MRKSGAEAGLMGVVPSYPAVKYGYILPGERHEGWISVTGLRGEKPDEEKARRLMEEGALWNCGVFCVRVGAMLEKAAAYGVPSDYEGLCAAYGRLPKISFDYEVLEKAQRLAAVEFRGYWKDLGTWGRHGGADEHRLRGQRGAGRKLRQHAGHQRAEGAGGGAGRAGSGGGGLPGRHPGGGQEPERRVKEGGRGLLLPPHV